jgi:transposase-like protein
MATATAPKTLQQAIQHFSDYENCKTAVMAIRWPNGTVACPACGSLRVKYLDKSRVWKCYEKHPKAKFSLKVGTIFEDSPVGLEKWLPALWMVVNCKNGISSYELARALGVTQKTAWFMLSRLRLALQSKRGGKLDGGIEIDETFIGAKARYMHADKKKRILEGHRGGMKGKVAVMGLLQRHPEKGKSQIRLQVVKRVKRGDLLPHIDANVAQGANVFTDALPSYHPLSQDYIHSVIDHAKSYANGEVHTNGMENFWSLLKRTLNGTYVSVEPFHLFRYLDEQAFRFNNRDGEDADRFLSGLKGILNRRLTYTALTGSEVSSR